MIYKDYTITEDESQKVIKAYFKEGPDGPLSELPVREKKKIIVLDQIKNRLDPARKYTEKEINEFLKTIYPDYAALRRALVDYRFMERLNDGSCYWVRKMT